MDNSNTICYKEDIYEAIGGHICDTLSGFKQELHKYKRYGSLFLKNQGK
jgi:hypothetical protein